MNKIIKYFEDKKVKFKNVEIQSNNDTFTGTTNDNKIITFIRYKKSITYYTYEICISNKTGVIKIQADTIKNLLQLLDNVCLNNKEDI